jgi:nicotinamide-nucleotide amidase
MNTRRDEPSDADILVEILVIGDEILLGDVLDTNSHWLCQQLTGLGARVRRITQIGDDAITIAETLRDALERDAQIIIAVGGLGPTEDDRTLAAVAEALERPIVEHPVAKQWVENTYRELARAGHVPSDNLMSEEAQRSRLKMAHLPQGAEPLYNQVGVAPGVLLRNECRMIVCLPGVPDEMKDIFQHALEPTLHNLLGAGRYAEWRVRAAIGDESVLAPLLRQISAEYPDVYIKSRARRFGEDRHFTITLSARGRGDGSDVEKRLEKAWQSLQRRLADEGIESWRGEDQDQTSW